MSERERKPERACSREGVQGCARGCARERESECKPGRAKKVGQGARGCKGGCTERV